MKVNRLLLDDIVSQTGKFYMGMSREWGRIYCQKNMIWYPLRGTTRESRQKKKTTWIYEISETMREMGLSGKDSKGRKNWRH